MFRATDLRPLSNTLGWRQNYNNADYVIDDALVVSKYGQYYQDVHPLITLDNVKAIAPNFTKINHPTWLIGTSYLVGTKVVLNTKTYVALQDNTGQDPEADDQNNPVYWDLFDAFSDWLKLKTEALALKFINSVITEKLGEQTTKNIIDSKALFDGAGRISNTIDNTSSLVGFEIIPIRAKGVTTKIDKISLQFTGGIEDLTCYLMHSSQSEPVKTVSLTRTKDNSSEWFTPSEDLYLSYDGPQNSPGGSWFIVYDQFVLGAGVKAISKDKDWSKKPCYSCNSASYRDQLVISKYIEVYPFKVSSVADGNPPELWNIANNIYTNDTNYGLNLQVSIQCDITDIILEQQKAFETGIGLQVASGLLREMAYNPNYNTNRTQQNFSKQELLYELDGDSQSHKKSGINYDLEQAKKAVKLDLNNLSRVCFSCKNGGIRYKTI